MQKRELSPEQESAVRHVRGPMLVVAGPGSGKTTVLTRRVEHLLNDAGARAEEILVITFTKAAALEMQERFIRIYQGGQDPKAVRFGTFHSVFYEILRREGASVRLIEQEEAQRMLAVFFRERLRCGGQEALWKASFVLSEISRLVNTGTIDPEEIRRVMSEADFYGAAAYYKEQKALSARIDFDDMMERLKDLFDRRPEILSGIRKRYRYILVDEFQDINRLQYELLLRMTGEERNLFVVGDDDQAIYGFRGSDPSYLLDFRSAFPGNRTVYLTANYRCKEEIVAASSRLIEHNGKRYEKRLVSAAGSGAAVHKVPLKNAEQESAYIVRLLKKREKTLPYREAAVLYRTREQGRELMERMLLTGIPFRERERLYDPLSSEMALDLKAYLDMALHPSDPAPIRRILNRPARGLLPEVLDYPGEDVLLASANSGFCTPDVLNRVLELRYHRRRLARLSLRRALLYIWKNIGYGEYQKGRSERLGLRYRDVVRHFEVLLKSTEGVRDAEEWIRLTDLSEKDGVLLSTMHGAKGLEFSLVILLDVNEGFCPFERAQTREQVEEERRVFYVAATRAKQTLYLLYTKDRKPSRFLFEMES